jgi:hypothetical protein
MWGSIRLCHKCKKEYSCLDSRNFSYTKIIKKYRYVEDPPVSICNNCYILIATCCDKFSLTDRCTIVRNYSEETKDIRDDIKIVQKLGVGRGGLKIGLKLFTKQVMTHLFIPNVAMLIYKYIDKKKMHLDLLSDYYKSNRWYCNHCGRKHTLYDDKSVPS